MRHRLRRDTGGLHPAGGVEPRHDGGGTFVDCGQVRQVGQVRATLGPVDRRQPVLRAEAGKERVAQYHQLRDHLVAGRGAVAQAHLDLARLTHLHVHLRLVQVDSAPFLALAAQSFCKAVQGLYRRAPRPLRLEDRVDLLIRQGGSAPYGRTRHAPARHLPLLGQVRQQAHSHPLFARVQASRAPRKIVRKHRYGAFREIQAGHAPVRLPVHQPFSRHERGRVGYVHAEPVAGLQYLQGEGVVTIDRLLVVDRERIQVRQVLPLKPACRGPGRRPRLPQDLGREVRANSRAAQVEELVRVEDARPDQHLEARPLEVASLWGRRLHQLPGGLPAGELLAVDRVALQYLDQRPLVVAHRIGQTACGQCLDQILGIPRVLGLASPPRQQSVQVLPRPRTVLRPVAHEEV